LCDNMEVHDKKSGTAPLQCPVRVTCDDHLIYGLDYYGFQSSTDWFLQWEEDNRLRTVQQHRNEPAGSL